MDPLSSFLAAPNARDAFSLAVVMDAPWSIAVEDRAAITVMCVVEGQLVLEVDGFTEALAAGQVAAVRGPAPYRVSDSAGRGTTVVIGPDQRCTTVAGEPVELAYRQGVRTWGNSAAGETRILIGTYPGEGSLGAFVAAALPRATVLAPGELEPLLVELLQRELAGAGLGQSAAIDRLLDLVLLHLVRAWQAREAGEEGDAHPLGWVGGRGDAVVAEALGLLHARPAEAWTVESLARAVHVARATLAARFRSAVGESPMAYLTRWRLALAGEAVLAGRTLAQVAAEVGYGSAFALSAAFRREHGVSPAEYRRRARAAAAAG